MVRKIILGKTDIETFVECIVNQYKLTFLTEEHISRTDRLKKYRNYDDGDEVKAELADMLNSFVRNYERNNYIRKISFNASKKPGLSNYIEITFNIPFGSKEWLKHMKIRVSDHPKMNDRKVDEYIYLENMTVAEIEDKLDRIIQRRIRRIEREEQGA